MPKLIENGIGEYMRRFRNILFALAAFLWLPASAHCQLESVPGLAFFQCDCSQQDGQGDCKDCGCFTVEKSQYHAEQLRLSVRVPDLLPFVFLALPIANEPVIDESWSYDLTAAPPDFQPSRSFILRTALPPRAPSLAA